MGRGREAVGFWLRLFWRRGECHAADHLWRSWGCSWSASRWVVAQLGLLRTLEAGPGRVRRSPYFRRKRGETLRGWVRLLGTWEPRQAATLRAEWVTMMDVTAGSEVGGKGALLN